MSTLLVENVTPVEQIVLDAAKELVEFREQARNNDHIRLTRELCNMVVHEAKEKIKKDPFKECTVTTFGMSDFKNKDEFQATHSMLKTLDIEELKRLLSPYFDDIRVNLDNNLIQIIVCYNC